MSSRIVALDIARGIAILLVIALHGVVSISGRLSDVSPAFMSFFDTLAPIRMPILMFLSGLFISHSIKKGVIAFVYGKFCHIVYPYLVWTLIMWVVVGLRDLVKTGEVMPLIEAIFLYPIEHLWFLHNLIIFFTFTLLLFFPQGEKFFLALVIGVQFIPNEYLQFRKDLFLLFCIGGAAGVYLKKIKDIKLASGISIISTVLFLIAAIYLCNYPAVREILFPLSMIPLIFGFGNVSFIAKNTKFIQWVGRNSLIFYLSHLPIQMLLVQAIKISVINDNYKVVVNMALGLILTTFFVVFCNKVGLCKKILFDFKKSISILGNRS